MKQKIRKDIREAGRRALRETRDNEFPVSDSLELFAALLNVVHEPAVARLRLDEIELSGLGAGRSPGRRLTKNTKEPT